MWNDLDSLLMRVRNWARWCKERERSKGHCLSIEHRYRSPQRDHWPDDAPPAIQGNVDLLDAYYMEDLMRLLHWRQRLIIRLKYVKAWKDGWIIAKLHINQRDFADAHYFSLIALNSYTKTHKRTSTVHGNNSGFEPSLLLAA